VTRDSNGGGVSFQIYCIFRTKSKVVAQLTLLVANIVFDFIGVTSEFLSQGSASVAVAGVTYTSILGDI